MNLLEQAFLHLHPQKKDFTYEIKYSKKFAQFNGNISFNPYTKHILMKMSHSWKEVSTDIQLGFIQYLLQKLFKTTKSSTQIELYLSFIKKIGTFQHTILSDPILEDSFERMNKKYFQNSLDKPNLVFGNNTFRKVGCYTYQNDMITISNVLRNRIDLIDFVMHHEMLHKKHKYYMTQTGRHMHHHKKFRDEEKLFEDFALMEKELQRFVSKWK